ncbi:zinc finger protein rotund [Hyalella azteca]|uniref:Zinc finger protein rotund n=1 Tax=Hyalella azteca TaxID=294128 RepID=A0A8B7PD41_HYAAZ|nr:zinc finger protein rotund [Hyalella azteca]
MLFAKHFLKQGLQVGPWKVTRKVLLFIIAFCVVVLAFGTLMLETHAFDADDDDDDDGSYERYDDDDFDEHWRFGGGDLFMMILMGLAGAGIIVSALACCFAQVNPPSHLESRPGEQVFTIQLTKPSIGPQHPEALSHYQHYHLQQQQQFERQYRQQQQQQATSQQQQPVAAHSIPQQQRTNSSQQQQETNSSCGSRPPHTSSREGLRHQRSAPNTHRHVRSPPPPYTPSPPAQASAPSAASPSDQPPPYSP